MKLFIKLALVVIASVSVLGPAWGETNNSLFSVPITWTDDAGKPVSLAEWKGKNIILVMAYTTCTTACPLTFKRLQGIETTLNDQKKNAEFVIVSFDPSRDTPDTFKHFRTMHNLDRPNWHLLMGTDSDVRKLSVLLGISYQQDPKTKEFVHSNKITLLDREGAVKLSLEGLASDTKPIVDAIEQ